MSYKHALQPGYFGGTPGKAIKLLIFVAYAVSGFVRWEEILFVVFASLYVWVMSSWVFPPVAPIVPGGIFPGSRLFMFYFAFVATTIGLFLPLGYTLFSLAVGDQTSVEQISPHLFLLIAQILTESVTFTKPEFSFPVRALVPILYNSRRILLLWIWAEAIFAKQASSISVGWFYFERFLVVSNVILWNFNLWVFLLPIFLPWAIRKHFEADLSLKAR